MRYVSVGPFVVFFRTIAPGGAALLRPGVLARSSLLWVLWARSMRKQSTGSLTRAGALLDWAHWGSALSLRFRAARWAESSGTLSVTGFPRNQVVGALVARLRSSLRTNLTAVGFSTGMNCGVLDLLGEIGVGVSRAERWESGPGASGSWSCRDC